MYYSIHLSLKVTEACKSVNSVRKIYQELVNSDEGGSRHVVTTPRNQKVQVGIHACAYGLKLIER